MKRQIISYPQQVNDYQPIFLKSQFMDSLEKVKSCSNIQKDMSNEGQYRDQTDMWLDNLQQEQIITSEDLKQQEQSIQFNQSIQNKGNYNNFTNQFKKEQSKDPLQHLLYDQQLNINQQLKPSQILCDEADNVQDSLEIKNKRIQKKKQKLLHLQQKLSYLPKRILRSQKCQNTPLDTQFNNMKINLDDQVCNNQKAHEETQHIFDIEQLQNPTMLIQQDHSYQQNTQDVSCQQDFVNQQQQEYIQKNYQNQFSNQQLNQENNIKEVSNKKVTRNLQEPLLRNPAFQDKKNNKNSNQFGKKSFKLEFKPNKQNETCQIEKIDSDKIRDSYLYLKNGCLRQEWNINQQLNNDKPINNSQNENNYHVQQNDQIETLNEEISQNPYASYNNGDEFQYTYYNNAKLENQQNDNIQKQNLNEIKIDISKIHKKNVVKNIMTSFKRFMYNLFEIESQPSQQKKYLFQKTSINTYFDKEMQENSNFLIDLRQTILYIYNRNQPSEGQLNEQEFAKKYKRYFENKQFNHYTISLLLKHQQYSHIFKYFLENFIVNWIINSKISNQNSHYQMIKFLLGSFNFPVLIGQLQNNSKRKEGI